MSELRTTREIPGTGGRLRTVPEDFVVEELPAYEPSGEGEHLYLWVEKRNLSADNLIRRVARALKVPSRDIGCAGLKDTLAVTRQFLSVPIRDETRLAALEGDQDLRVLTSTRHNNKLKTGHLLGNRFAIRIRDVDGGALENGRATAAALAERGVPNFFGPQRFGREGETAAIGLALLRGERHPALGRIHRSRRGFLRRLGISAAQAMLFNRGLAARMHDGLLHKLLGGDVCLVCASGGPFVVDDPSREQPRFAAHEIVTAGPIFGPKMRPAKGDALDREEALLDSINLTMASFAHQGKLAAGTRRANLLWPEMSIEAEGKDLWAHFTLPKGSYATVILDELMKVEDPTTAYAIETPCDP